MEDGFNRCKNAGDEGATVEEVKKEVSFLNDASNYRTPSKKRKEAMMSEESEESLGNVEFVAHTRSLPADLSTELDEIIDNRSTMEKGGLTCIVARLEFSMVAQGSALPTVAELSYKRFLSNENDLRAVSSVVQNVQASVGETVELESKFDAPTLWSATAFVSEEVDRMTSGLKNMEADIIPMKESMKVLSAELARVIASGAKPPTSQ